MKLLAFVALLGIATPLAAQTGVPSPEGWSVAISGGGTAFSDFYRSTIEAAAPLPSGGIELREIPRRVGVKTSAAVAAAVSYWPNRNWGIRLFGSYAPSRFMTVISESDAEFMDVPRTSEETHPLASLAITAYDAQALFRLPTIRQRIMPYGFVGAGVVHYQLAEGGDPIPEEATSAFASGTTTRPALRVGLGALLPMNRSGWALSFELHDQISRSPLQGGGNQEVRVTNALAFMVGMRWAP